MAPTPAQPQPPTKSATIKDAVGQTATATRGKPVEERGRNCTGTANAGVALSRHVQYAHTQGVSNLLKHSERGFAPASTNLCQNYNYHAVLRDQGQVNMHDQQRLRNKGRLKHGPKPVHGRSKHAGNGGRQITPSKHTSKTKAPKSEARQSQTRFVASLLDECCVCVVLWGVWGPSCTTGI